MTETAQSQTNHSMGGHDAMNNETELEKALAILDERGQYVPLEDFLKVCGPVGAGKTKCSTKVLARVANGGGDVELTEAANEPFYEPTRHRRENDRQPNPTGRRKGDKRNKTPRGRK